MALLTDNILIIKTIKINKKTQKVYHKKLNSNENYAKISFHAHSCGNVVPLLPQKLHASKKRRSCSSSSILINKAANLFKSMMMVIYIEIKINSPLFSATFLCSHYKGHTMSTTMAEERAMTGSKMFVIVLHN
jgi:hypothetical protein